MSVGIITGSGTYALPGLEDSATVTVHTRFGTVEVTSGRWRGAEVVHVSRHGEGHLRLSSQVNHRANVLALREAGAEVVLAATICGAVDPGLELGQLVVFDDQSVSALDRGWALAEIRRCATRASIVYVAGQHDHENERRARAGGVLFYTSKPLRLSDVSMILDRVHY